jgi:uncharacterized protein
MPLSPIELRVLGALIEKDATTPESYPLSIGALVTACNQKTSRDPVTDYHLQEVQEAVARLRDRGLVATVQEVSDRVPKHRHKAAQALDADLGELALLSVLMLRGEQTAGELRARTERYVAFSDLAEVEAVLRALETRRVPLVKNKGRSPGRSQDRWAHTLGSDEEKLQPRVRGRVPGDDEAPRDGAEPGASAPSRAAAAPDVTALEGRIAALEERVAELERRRDERS